ncbi:DUF397 domain-containing protein [Streptomyces olivoverticillatus]|uniref:DUF397 domain-containing protein n=1 Tax=Streptomyces olivoverticillatus TaxID=66427 RepID=UPI0031B57AFA
MTAWRKSSYSGANGGNCVEATVLGAAQWRKSSHSGHDAGDCIEIAPDIPDFVPVRDSKHPQGPILTFQAQAWTAFVEALKAD